MHGGATCVVEQGRPFECTLTPSQDQAALPFQVPEIDEITGMHAATCGHALDQFGGQMLEVLQAYGDHRVLSADSLAVRHGRAKLTALTICPIEPLDKDRQSTYPLLFLEPLRVGQVELERERFDIAGRQVLDVQELLNRMEPKGVKMPVAGRAQI